MMGYGAGLGLGWGFGGMLVAAGCVALVVGIVLLVAWALGRGNAGHAPSAPVQVAPAAPDPLEVLRMRLARGEISTEEFAAIRQALEAGR